MIAILETTARKYLISYGNAPWRHEKFHCRWSKCAVDKTCLVKVVIVLLFSLNYVELFNK